MQSPKITKRRHYGAPSQRAPPQHRRSSPTERSLRLGLDIKAIHTSSPGHHVPATDHPAMRGPRSQHHRLLYRTATPLCTQDTKSSRHHPLALPPSPDVLSLRPTALATKRTFPRRHHSPPNYQPLTPNPRHRRLQQRPPPPIDGIRMPGMQPGTL
jgi:hypothetical protein